MGASQESVKIVRWQIYEPDGGRIMLTPDPYKTRLFQPHMTAIAVESATALFSAYGLSLSTVPGDVAEAQTDLAYIALMKFANPQANGTLVLGCGEHTLASSIPAPAAPRDWMAELANQLFGRMKNRLLRQDVVFWGVPPSVVSGQHLVPVFNRADFAPVLFSDGDGGKICMWVEVEVSAAFQFAGPEVSADIPAEGDVIMF